MQKLTAEKNVVHTIKSAYLTKMRPIICAGCAGACHAGQAARENGSRQENRMTFSIAGSRLQPAPVIFLQRPLYFAVLSVTI